MCSALPCRKTSNDTTCVFTFGYGAAEGTTCGSGKVCSNLQCVSNATAPTGTCLFGDDVVVNGKVIGDPLPQAQLDCESTLDYISSNLNQYALAYCSDAVFGATCCQTCKSMRCPYDYPPSETSQIHRIILLCENKRTKGYQDIACVDLEPNCPQWAIFCGTGAVFNNVSVDSACSRTCGTCISRLLNYMVAYLQTVQLTHVCC